MVRGVECKMKWLILSDNHGGWSKLNQLVADYRPKVDLIIHCGDSEFPADDPIWEQVDVVVSGNMDFDPQYLKKRYIDTTEGKILVVHGHLNGVNSGNQELLAEAKRSDAKFVFHGHTHKLYAEYTDGILMLNPGSLNHSRGPVPYRTFAIMELTSAEIIVKFYNDEMDALDHLTERFDR